jgi:tetratricopeptide (TPR) repeat protein
MRWACLSILLAAAATLATVLEPAFGEWSQRKAPAPGLLASLLGDSRRLFANHFFIQSDVYLHGGYYPGIFDQPAAGPGKDEPSAALRPAGQRPDNPEHEGHDQDAPWQHDFLGRPRNWIDAFGRHFFPSQHTHLGEGTAKRAQAREILPWIKFSAELDPRRAETYTVGAYWLREMGRHEEALRFLREGLRHNPASYEILFDLGACYEDRKDAGLARNLWELAWRRWQEQQAGSQEPDRLAAAQILTRLTRLEVRQNQRAKAIGYLELLKQYSPTPAQVQQRLEEVKAGLPYEAEGKP